MNAITSPRSSDSVDDLSALAWVHDELRRSLDAAHKALRRFVREAEAIGGSDLDAVDPLVLRGARAQIHQGVGALELVGLPAAAAVLRASEALVQRVVAKPQRLTAGVLEAVEQASFGVLDYLGRLLAGRQVSPLSLFPQYRAVLEAAGAERVHPADLWSLDWQWHDLPCDDSVAPRQADAATRGALEGQLLTLMKTPNPAVPAGRMSDICAGLAGGAAERPTAIFWNLAAAVFEAQAHALLGFDVFSKRVASRLLAQFRTLERGEGEVSERLAQDLLFFCAQSESPGDGRRAPRLAAVRQVYGLAHHLPADYNASSLGRFDPALVLQARKRVAAAKEAWSAVAGGEMHRLTGLSEQFALVAESLRRLFPLGEVFSAELQQAVTQTQQARNAPPAPLAMEVATSLLYVEAVLEDADFDHPEQAGRVQRLADRLHGVRQGRAPDPLEAWMEELYRRVSDRQTMGSVVQELRASLSDAEHSIDQFFRDPSQHAVLTTVPNQLASMRGVLSVLGMDHAAGALLRMRDEVDGLISTEIEPQHVAQAGVFDRLAGNLGALGFLIDMLSVQPQMARSLFQYDADAGVLSPVMGREVQPAPAGQAAAPAAPVEQRLIEQAQSLAFSAVRADVPLEAVSRDLDRLSQEAIAADLPTLAATVQKAREAIDDAGENEAGVDAARGELSEALVDFVHSTSEPVGLDAPIPAPSSSAFTTSAPGPMGLNSTGFGAAPAAAVDPGLGDDPEMREVFLEEAREVLAEAKAARTGLLNAPDDLSLLTTLRRAFHTLKGSSRMVGLAEFGDAAWTCEQLYNTHLADQAPAGAPLLDFTAKSLAYLGDWVDAIAAGEPGSNRAEAIRNAAARLAEPTASASQAPSLLPPDLPSAADLDLVPLPFSIDSGAFELPSRVTEIDLEAPISFDFQLSGLDAPFVASSASVASMPMLADDSLTSSFGRFDLDMPVEAPGSPEGPAVAPSALLESTDATDEIDLVGLDGLDARERSADAAPDSAVALDPALPEVVEVDAEMIPPSARTTATAEAPQVALDEALAAWPGADSIDIAEQAIDGEAQAFKSVGPLRIGIPLFNIYLNEADELSRRLGVELAEWAMELHRPIGETPIALAHSLAGSSATVGFADLSQLARSLEHAQARSQAIGHGTEEEGLLFVAAADEIRRLLHQFAAGLLQGPSVELLARLADHEHSSALRLEAATAAAEQPSSGDGQTRIATVEEWAVGDGSRVVDVEATVIDDAATAEAATADAPATETAPVDTALDANARPATAVPAAVAAFAAAGISPLRLEDAVDVSVTPPPASFELTEFKPFGEPLDRGRAAAPSRRELVDADSGIDAVDSVDPELFQFFEEEAEELLPQLAARLRDWSGRPTDHGHPAACMRTLHTLKGGARLAGAMRLGEMAHRLETRIERLLATPPVVAADVERLQHHGDALTQSFDALRRGDLQAQRDAEQAFDESTPRPVAGIMAAGIAEVVEVPATAEPAEAAPAFAPTVDASPAAVALLPHHGDATGGERATLAARIARAAAELSAIEPPPVPTTGFDAVAPSAPHPALKAPDDETAPIDWSRFAVGAASRPRAVESGTATQSSVRVRAPVLDRLVNQAGEVSITRSRIESGVAQIKHSLADLTENLDRMRAQLRDLEFHGELQMTSRMEAAKAAAEAFDPLEFDRFTRFQELTRMMAESVNDVATVQRTVQRALESTEDELVAQSRLTRDLQDDLLRTRMVEFEGLSDRLYRVVRQAAKETAKSVRLDIVGGGVEVDRGVLDRMTGAFEHLLRNSVTHGIETPAVRTAAGKDPTGSVTVVLTQEGNEVGVEFRDDGAGLDLARIRARGVALGLLTSDAPASDAELANLIFLPGFTTAEGVTELAGRGVGMDVVRSEVNAMGGRIETATSAGHGTSFRLILPLTTAVTQVVMLRCGELQVAVPSTLVDAVQRLASDTVDAAYVDGSLRIDEALLPFYWLGALLQTTPRPALNPARTRMVVVIRSAQQRIALHVDEVLGNQEVVVKNLGPQLSRMPGLAGVTLLASGSVTLIYNPVALATLYGETAQAATRAALRGGDAAGSGGAQPRSGGPEVPLLPLVMVVDDSLTVRRVTQRLLVREGYRVVLAKDGLDALERLAEEVPQIVLSDIEMPRMDGFDLVRNLRADARLRDLPVIMITSRIAQKHRDHAAELGVDHYLGKPYAEEDLLSLVARYTRHAVAA